MFLQGYLKVVEGPGVFPFSGEVTKERYRRVRDLRVEKQFTPRIAQSAVDEPGSSRYDSRSKLIKLFERVDRKNEGVHCPRASRPNGPGQHIISAVRRTACSCFSTDDDESEANALRIVQKVQRYTCESALNAAALSLTRLTETGLANSHPQEIFPSLE